MNTGTGMSTETVAILVAVITAVVGPSAVAIIKIIDKKINGPKNKGKRKMKRSKRCARCNGRKKYNKYKYCQACWAIIKKNRGPNQPSPPSGPRPPVLHGRPKSKSSDDFGSI